MKKITLIIVAALMVIHSTTYGQCLTNSIVVSTGYNPVTGHTFDTGTHDLRWKVTALTPDCAATCACSPGYQAWVIPPLVFTGFSWANDTGSKWISFYHGTGFPTTPADTMSEILTRTFRTCVADSFRLNVKIANDNFITNLNIDSGAVLFSQPTVFTLTNFTTFTAFSATVWLTPGIHKLNVTVVNESVTNSGNAYGLNIVGTLSSATGHNSIVKESDTACNSYSCTTGTEQTEKITSSLMQNFPNPFTEETVIPFSLAETADVTIDVCNLSGQKILTLYKPGLTSGNHEVSINAGTHHIAPGNYIYQISIHDANSVYLQHRMFTVIK